VKVTWYVICILAVIWAGSELFVSRVQKAYYQGYSDGLRAAPRPQDGQCAAWLFETNIKDAKRRICK
jgi:hypothetical protein